MWTTSNSRADRRRALVAAAIVAACASGRQAGGSAPDNPRPARDMTGLTQPPPRAGEQRMADRPVEIAAVRLRRVRGDTMLTRLAGPALLDRASAPIAIDVTTVEPLGDVTRDAAWEIFLDTARVGDTWPLPPNRLVAFVPDVQSLRAGMAVTVARLGAEELTRSRRPVVLTEEHLREVR